MCIIGKPEDSQMRENHAKVKNDIKGRTQTKKSSDEIRYIKESSRNKGKANKNDQKYLKYCWVETKRNNHVDGRTNAGKIIKLSTKKNMKYRKRIASNMKLKIIITEN